MKYRSSSVHADLWLVVYLFKILFIRCASVCSPSEISFVGNAHYVVLGFAVHLRTLLSKIIFISNIIQ